MDEDVGLYKIVKTICNAMAASVKFIRNCETIRVTEGLLLAQQGLSSLNFHKNTSFINGFITMCSERLKQVTPVSEG